MLTDKIVRAEEIEELIYDLEQLVERRTLRFLRKIKQYQIEYESGEITEETLFKRTRLRVESLAELINGINYKIEELRFEQKQFLE